VWDTVKIPFPYTDRPVRQCHPALVVAADEIEATHGQMWLIMITSAENRGWPDDVLISDLRAAGLPAPSIARTAKIATLDAGAAQRLGKCPLPIVKLLPPDFAKSSARRWTNLGQRRASAEGETSDQPRSRSGGRTPSDRDAADLLLDFAFGQRFRDSRKMHEPPAVLLPLERVLIAYRHIHSSRSLLVKSELMWPRRSASPKIRCAGC
jgi:mRNA interferase MazF